MKVRMLVTISGTRNGVDWPPAGSEVDLPAHEASDYIAAGLAAAVAPETASAPETENAAAPKPRARKAAQA